MRLIRLYCKTRGGSNYVLDEYTCENDTEYGVALKEVKEKMDWYRMKKEKNFNEMFTGTTYHRDTPEVDINYDLVEYGEIVKLYIVNT